MTVERALERSRVHLFQTLEVGGAEATKEAVRAGLGIAIISQRAVTKEVAAGHLKIIDVVGMNPVQQLAMVSARARRLSVAALAFAAHVQKSW